MTALQGLRIFGPCDAETLAAEMNKHRPRYAQLHLNTVKELINQLEDELLAYNTYRYDFDLTPLGVDEFKRGCKRAKDEARLCQGVGVA